jgi:hypothetical protein
LEDARHDGETARGRWKVMSGTRPDCAAWAESQLGQGSNAFFLICMGTEKA